MSSTWASLVILSTCVSDTGLICVRYRAVYDHDIFFLIEYPLARLAPRMVAPGAFTQMSSECVLRHNTLNSPFHTRSHVLFLDQV